MGERMRLEAIRERERNATSGPWRVVNGRKTQRPCSITSTFGDIVRWMGLARPASEGARRDAEFIAESRQDIPWLIARVDELAACVRGYYEQGEHYGTNMDANAALAKLNEVDDE